MTRPPALQRTARLVLIWLAVLQCTGALTLSHASPVGWTQGTAVHAPGQCPDGGPAHNEDACATCRTSELAQYAASAPTMPSGILRRGSLAHQPCCRHPASCASTPNARAPPRA